MTTGEKIKQIRQHRKMTQKELGEKIGLGDGGANRIAQYEMGYRVPKKPLLIKMAEALAVSPLALLEPSNRNISGIMETLFWMDEDMGGVLQFTTVTYDGPEDPEELEEPRLTGNITVPASGFPPTVLWTENAMLDGFFKEWSDIQQAYYEGKITHDQYFEWKIRWPLDSEIRSTRELAEIECLF